MNLSEEDIKVVVYSNHISNVVSILHIPTGIVMQSDSFTSKLKAREQAMERLIERLQHDGIC